MKNLNLGGLVLIAIGVFFLFVQGGIVGPEAIVLVIGLGFLVAYYAGHQTQLGFLIPGSLLTGIGLGVILISGHVYPRLEGSLMLLCLAAGFLGITLLALDHPRWPLIPGGVLACLALLTGSTAIPGFRLLRRIAIPAALIIVGFYIALQTRRRA